MHIQENSVTTKVFVNQQVCCIIFREASSGPIFGNEIEKKRFLDMLLDTRQSFCTEIYAYCILDGKAYILAGAERRREIESAAVHLKTKFELYYQKNYPGEMTSLCCGMRWLEYVSWESVALECVKLHQLPVKDMRVERSEDYWWSSLKEYLLRYQSGIIRPQTLLEGLDLDRRSALRKMRTLRQMENSHQNNLNNKNV